MSRIRAAIAWIAILGGGIGFYFLYGQAADFMRG